MTMNDAGEEHTASMVLNALMRMRMKMTSSSRTTHPSSRTRGAVVFVVEIVREKIKHVRGKEEAVDESRETGGERGCD